MSITNRSNVFSRFLVVVYIVVCNLQERYITRTTDVYVLPGDICIFCIARRTRLPFRVYTRYVCVVTNYITCVLLYTYTQ